MTTCIWEKIKNKIDEHGYMTGIDRESRRKMTHEVFTPSYVVVQMLQELGHENFSAGKTILDPACGDGQFLVGAKWVKVYFHSMTEEDAVKDIYGVDIMKDNVEMCKSRLGGGNIYHGNTLEPGEDLEGQSKEDKAEVQKLFAKSSLLDDAFDW